MIHSILRTWNVANKRVLVRADLNVPMINGTITNDFRLTSIQPTIDYILSRNGSVVLATHIGRPNYQEQNLSTQLLIPWFTQHGYSIIFEKNITNIARAPIIPKQIIMMENLRFFQEEKNGDPFFAKQLANTATFYVNDAFGVIHRHDTSVSLTPYEFPENKRSIGFLIEKELRTLESIKNNPQHPFLAILGGGKIEDKIPLIQQLLKTVNTIAICPALCFSFLKALHQPVGKSLVNDSLLTICKSILQQAENNNVKILFPTDYYVAKDDINGSLSITSAKNFPADAIGITIGPETVKLFTTEINQARTIFFNCAMGFANRPETEQSTYNIIKAMSYTKATTVIAGGDSIDAAFKSGVAESISHLSIGGGATLAYLSGSPLPGLVAFKEE